MVRILWLASLLLALQPAAWGAVPSAGCGVPSPEVPPSRIEVGGRQRGFITAVPGGYDPDVLHALVFAFHGRTTPNTQVRRYFGLEQAATVPTIVVYPAALVAADGKFSWYERGQSGSELRDYAFVDALLELMGETYCVDLDRVFVVGHSLGGSFANSLGCARGDVIRGVGTVAGRIWESPCSGPAAAIIMHNPHDDLVPLTRGLEARDWALVQNGLDGAARACEPTTLKCECYGPPDAEDPVVWCPHTQDVTRSGRAYPHLWPDAAGVAIMEFFEGLP